MSLRLIRDPSTAAGQRMIPVAQWKNAPSFIPLGIDRSLTLREERSGSGHGCERPGQTDPTEAALS